MMETRRRREITGPFPQSVAMFAMPSRPRVGERLIAARQAEESARREAAEQKRRLCLSEMRSDWEKNSERKLRYNEIRRRVKGALGEQEEALNVRRMRLRELLAQEEAQLAAEAEGMRETPLERQAKMRERARQLREEREAERLDLVQEKLEQQFREQCEDLRSVESKKTRIIIEEERAHQMALKREREAREKEEEEMFHQLWQSDMLAKENKDKTRERMEEMEQQKMQLVRQEQMELVKTMREEQLQLAAEESALMEEQRKLDKIAAEKEAAEKMRKNVESKRFFAAAAEERAAQKAKEEHERRAYDMKMLEQVLQEAKVEQENQQQKKKEHRQQMLSYMKYLKEMKAEDAAREKQMEALCDAEVEKMWRRRTDQWGLEKQARQRLFDDVVAFRQQQIQDKLTENERKQREAQEEQAALLGQLQENKRQEVAERLELEAKNRGHYADVRDQIAFNRSIRDSDREEDERRRAARRAAELEQQAKISSLLTATSTPPARMHPMKRAVATQLL